MSAIPVEKFKDYILMKLPAAYTAESYKEFETEVLGLTDTHVVINCESQTYLPKNWLRTLMKLHMTLRTKNRSLRLTNLNPIMMNSLKAEGVDQIFTVNKDSKEALSQIGIVAPKKTLDTQFIDPFLTAVIHVLKIQASVDVSPGKIALKTPNTKTSGDISGIIGIISDTFNGSVVISFPEETFLKIMTNMLGEEVTELNQDIVDGAGELTNIIFGQAKITLNEKGYGIHTAIPSVVTGKNHSLSAQTKGPVVMVNFESTAGPFCVEICM